MNYSTRYQADRDPVLRDITTKITGGEKVPYTIRTMNYPV